MPPIKQLQFCGLKIDIPNNNNGQCFYEASIETLKEEFNSERLKNNLKEYTISEQSIIGDVS